MRERQKRREYESYEDLEAERREEMSKERKRIAAFLEDYEDERDDEKYYRGEYFNELLILVKLQFNDQTVSRKSCNNSLFCYFIPQFLIPFPQVQLLHAEYESAREKWRLMNVTAKRSVTK